MRIRSCVCRDQVVVPILQQGSTASLRDDVPHLERLLMSAILILETRME